MKNSIGVVLLCSMVYAGLDAVPDYSEYMDITDLQIDIVSVRQQFSYDAMITQNDIGSGNTFTMDKPGVYCLASDVTFDTGCGIRITGNDVELRLAGHTISGTGDSETIAILVDGASNIVICGGEIVGGGCAIKATRSNNVRMRDMRCMDNKSIGVLVDDTSDVTMQDVVVNKPALDGIVVENNSHHICIKDSAVSSGGRNGVNIKGAIGCCLSDVKVFDVREVGFLGQAPESTMLSAVVYKNCIAGKTGSSCFKLITTSYLGKITGIDYIQCMSFYAMGDGFSVEVSGYDQYEIAHSSLQVQHVMYTHCKAVLTTGSGFVTSGGDYDSISNVIYDHCKACANRLHGFATNHESVVVRDCIVAKNGGDGICLGSESTGSSVMYCTSHGNGGKDLGNAGTDNFVYGNNNALESKVDALSSMIEQLS